MSTIFTCDLGTIAPYIPSTQMPWDKLRAVHLFRRAGFGASHEQITTALEKTPAEIVDQLVDEAIAKPIAPPPEWADWNINDYATWDELLEINLNWRREWVKEMITDGVRDKIALFWHNHFVARIDVYVCPSYHYRYRKALQQHALGNFKTFVHEIGLTGAMLYYLNGVQNTSISPNENYARELLELFTLGADNGYTQQDIEEAARALTGWVGIWVGCEEIVLDPGWHDNGQKTIFGRTGNWGYDELIDILFEERGSQIAQFICSKIYKHFISPKVDQGIVDEMAATFMDNNFELAPVFRQLFKSQHFFSEALINIRVKDPIEYMLGYITEAEFGYSDSVLDLIIYIAFELGQEILNPVDVAGWQGDRAWLNANTLTTRWLISDYYINIIYEQAPSYLIDLAVNLIGNTNDPVYATQVIVDHFIPIGLQTPEAYDQATEVFKWEVPQNYYDTGQWDLNYDTVEIQIALLLQHISRMPEFQLG